VKDMIIEQLQKRVGLSAEQATQAAEVVTELLEKHGVTLAQGVTEKLPGGIGDAVGGLLGGKGKQ